LKELAYAPNLLHEANLAGISCFNVCIVLTRMLIIRSVTEVIKIEQTCSKAGKERDESEIEVMKHTPPLASNATLFLNQLKNMPLQLKGQ
jgi:hypothetical protein